MSKKPVPYEEKRKRIVELLQQRKHVFQVKELETIAYKEKGIPSNTVKDVVEALASDGVIDGDKVGISNYYWSFPSETTNKLKRQITDLTGELDETRARAKRMRQTVEHESVGKEESAENDGVFQVLQQMKEKKERLLRELKQFEQCDPIKMKEKQDFLTIAKGAADRWTENIFQLHKWIKENAGVPMSSADIKREFNLDEDIDYVE